MTEKLPWSVSRLLNDPKWWGHLQEARRRKQSCGANDEVLNKWLRTLGWDVRRYAECKTLDGRRWYEILRDRAALRDCVQHSVGAAGGNLEQNPTEKILKFLAALCKAPLQISVLTDQLWTTSVSVWTARPERRAVRDLDVLDAIAVSDQLEAVRPKYGIGAEEHVDHEYFEFYTQSRAVALFGDRSRRGERREILTINLEHSDARILDEFRQWLKETRAREESKSGAGRDDRRRTLRTLAPGAQYQAHVLACIDLDLLADALGIQRLTVRALAVHLALDDATIEKVVRPRAVDLLRHESQEQLRYAVAEGDKWVDRVDFEVQCGDHGPDTCDLEPDREFDGVFVDSGDGTPIMID